LPQAAPKTLRRCTVYIGMNKEPSSRIPADERSALQLIWCPDGLAAERLEKQLLRCTAELLEAVGSYAAGRGVNVALEEDGRCLQLDLA